MELGQKHEKTRLPPSHEPLRAPGKAKSGESKEGRETKAKRGRQKGREHSTGDRAESTGRGGGGGDAAVHPPWR